MNGNSRSQHRLGRGRRIFVLGLLAAAGLGMVVRAVYLQLIHDDFLREQGSARFARTVQVPAYRGMIVDRHGEPLAASSPVGSVWTDPVALLEDRTRLPELARALGQDAAALERRVVGQAEAGRQFLYLQRHLEPSRARAIVDLGINGVYQQREYRRFYPDAEVSAHLIGYTDIDDRGQEGLELSFDHVLRGTPGRKRVVRDLRGRTVEELENLRNPRPGNELVLSLDRRIQYYAYRALKATVQQYDAEGGTVVVLDPHSGEILALANQPAGNPNDRRQRRSALLRNRAVTDVFEPGSTLKPFTVAAALEAGHVEPATPIDTRPGVLRIGRRTVRDIRNYGQLDVTRVLVKSSNVGVTLIAQRMPPERLWHLYRDLGFGAPTGIEMHGEQRGMLDHHRGWGEFEYATRSFGYGISVNALQLAQAYAVLASDGLRPPLTLIRRSESPSGRVRVLSASTARQVREMLEGVTGTGGTARRAAVPGYRVAGKTGTVHKVVDGRYARDRYISLFSGLAPVSRPELVAVVMIDEPKGKRYYGGLVAAPVFSEVMRHALRLRGVLPDDLGGPVQTAAR
jgi:cell division protein FtsI (penicillin-binding protein 3)